MKILVLYLLALVISAAVATCIAVLLAPSGGQARALQDIRQG